MIVLGHDFTYSLSDEDLKNDFSDYAVDVRCSICALEGWIYLNTRKIYFESDQWNGDRWSTLIENTRELDMSCNEVIIKKLLE